MLDVTLTKRNKGYFLVPCPESVSMGVRTQPRPRRHCFPTGIPGHEERLFERQLQVFCHGIPEIGPRKVESESVNRVLCRLSMRVSNC